MEEFICVHESLPFAHNQEQRKVLLTLSHRGNFRAIKSSVLESERLFSGPAPPFSIPVTLSELSLSFPIYKMGMVAGED